jgi:hypothetical protein
LVEEAIVEQIEPEAWDRSIAIEKAECESMRTVLDNWNAAL